MRPPGGLKPWTRGQSRDAVRIDPVRRPGQPLAHRPGHPVQVAVSEEGERPERGGRVESIAEQGGGRAERASQVHFAQPQEGIDVEVVRRAGTGLDGLERGGCQVRQGGDPDAGRLGTLRLVHTLVYNAVGEGDAHDSATIHDAREHVPATPDDLGVAQVRDPVDEPKRIERLRRQEAELVRPAMRQPERERGSAVEHETVRCRPKLREHAPLMMGEGVQPGLQQEMPPHLPMLVFRCGTSRRSPRDDTAMWRWSESGNIGE